MRKLFVAATLLGTLLLSGCGYNAMQSQDETIKASWAEVLNQYQRRADLVPNLVQTVKGFAAQEQAVLIGVTEARAKATSVRVDAASINDPAKLRAFQAAQGELSGALGRLLVVTENYPQLKSDQRFRDLQAQLEGTENRITVARRDYIDAVRAYNTELRTFPGVIWASTAFRTNKPLVEFAAGEAAQTPPQVKF